MEDVAQEVWNRVGTAWNGASPYEIWRRVEDGAFSLTVDGPPGDGDGGYARLDAIMKLKGCTRHDVVGEPTAPWSPRP